MTEMRPRGGGTRRVVAILAMAVLAGGTLVAGTSAWASAQPTIKGCRNVEPPPGFHRAVVTAIRVSGNLSRTWADSKFIPMIVCWQDTTFDTAFHARDSHDVWHGLFAMTVRELNTIAGPWMSNDRNELILDPACFVEGWDACSHTTAHTRTIQQLIAGLRWIWLDYGLPSDAWEHIVRTGRLTSFSRPGTDDTATRTPLRLCPVGGSVAYRDDYGVPRTTGGYHPHWGNDIHAALGRPIRAPFAGLAVGRSDDWFGGHSVTVVGAEGYVRNGHMVRFGHLGYVRAGTVIGYVGSTGDARTTHDHFEWHPWNLPRRLHVAPSGFDRILDGIDPFPFLNRVCP